MLCCHIIIWLLIWLHVHGYYLYWKSFLYFQDNLKSSILCRLYWVDNLSSFQFCHCDVIQIQLHSLSYSLSYSTFTSTETVYSYRIKSTFSVTQKTIYLNFQRCSLTSASVAGLLDVLNSNCMTMLYQRLHVTSGSWLIDRKAKGENFWRYYNVHLSWFVIRYFFKFVFNFITQIQR